MLHYAICPHSFCDYITINLKWDYSEFAGLINGNPDVKSDYAGSKITDP